MLNAVQTLRVHRRTGTDQGLRNHALLAALLGSSLRVSEVINLDTDQDAGKGLPCVQTKSRVIRDGVPVHRDARQVLDAWLKARQNDSPALLLTRTGRKLSRCEASGIIRRVAAQAPAHVALIQDRHAMPGSPEASNGQRPCSPRLSERFRTSLLGYQQASHVVQERPHGADTAGCGVRMRFALSAGFRSAVGEMRASGATVSGGRQRMITPYSRTAPINCSHGLLGA
jgi:hypothetical protein